MHVPLCQVDRGLTLGGVVPNEEYQSSFLYYQSVQHQYCSSFTMTRMFRHKKELLLSGTAPHVSTSVVLVRCLYF